MGDWRKTQHGEFVRDEVGLVASAQPHVWWAYPFREKGRLGPFATSTEARQALERLRGIASSPPMPPPPVREAGGS
jgi:hypothetical protein